MSRDLLELPDDYLHAMLTTWLEMRDLIAITLTSYELTYNLMLHGVSIKIYKRIQCSKCNPPGAEPLKARYNCTPYLLTKPIIMRFKRTIRRGLREKLLNGVYRQPLPSVRVIISRNHDCDTDHFHTLEPSRFMGLFLLK